MENHEKEDGKRKRASRKPRGSFWLRRIYKVRKEKEEFHVLQYITTDTIYSFCVYSVMKRSLLVAHGNRGFKISTNNNRNIRGLKRTSAEIYKLKT